MSIENRLEAVERQLIRLNTTLQELISLYVDTRTNPLLGNLPDEVGYMPTIIKQRNARDAKKGQIHYSIAEVRDITNDAISTFDNQHVYAILKAFGADTVADLTEDNYFPYCQTLLADIKAAEI